MPYDVESPLASGVGFAAAYLQGKQAKQKAQQDFQQQQLENSQNAAYLSLAQQQGENATQAAGQTFDANAATNAQTAADADAHKKLEDFVKKNPRPKDFAGQTAWDNAYFNTAAGLGVGKDAAAELSSMSLAEDRGSTSQYTLQGKLPLAQAQTTLTGARTKLTNELAYNAKHAFEQKMAQLRLQGNLAATRQLQSLQAASDRVLMQQGGANQRAANAQSGAMAREQYSTDARTAISSMAALIALNGQDVRSATEIALRQYSGQVSQYNAQVRADSAAQGKGLDVPYPDVIPQGGQPAVQQAPVMPNVNVSVLGGGGGGGIDSNTLAALLLARYQNSQGGGGGVSGGGGGNTNPQKPQVHNNAKTYVKVDNVGTARNIANIIKSGQGNAGGAMQSLQSRNISPQDIQTILTMALAEAKR